MKRIEDYGVRDLATMSDAEAAKLCEVHAMTKGVAKPSEEPPEDALVYLEPFGEPSDQKQLLAITLNSGVYGTTSAIEAVFDASDPEAVAAADSIVSIFERFCVGSFFPGGNYSGSKATFSPTRRPSFSVAKYVCPSEESSRVWETLSKERLEASERAEKARKRWQDDHKSYLDVTSEVRTAILKAKNEMHEAFDVLKTYDKFLSLCDGEESIAAKFVEDKYGEASALKEATRWSDLYEAEKARLAAAEKSRDRPDNIDASVAE